MSCTTNLSNYMIDDRCGAKYPVPTEERRKPEKLRDIRIKEIDAGYIVEIGCQTFAIESKGSLISKLSAYINDPKSVEDAWMKDHKLPKK
jgi:hypothetical protein